MEPENNQKSTSSTPDTWPGALGIYGFSRDGVKYNLGTYLPILFAPYAINILAWMLGIEETTRDAISTVAHTIFGVATIIAILAALRGTKLSFQDTFKQTSLLLFLKYFILGILIGIIYAISFLLLVIPFFFVAPRLALAPYFLVDKRLGILESLRVSWDATKGHVSKVYGIVGIFIAMTLLAITIIGIPFSIYFLIMYSAAFPLLYLHTQKQQHTSDETSNSASTDPFTSNKQKPLLPT